MRIFSSRSASNIVFCVLGCVREDDGQEDYQEKIETQLAEQEEDDLERIKEESRRRRQAILEKYKNQKQQHDTSSQGNGKSCCLH